jgi:hypothetical protein
VDARGCRCALSIYSAFEAGGSCKCCAHGLCHWGAAEREGGLARKGRCDAEVDAVTRFVCRNVRAKGVSPWPIALVVLIYWGVRAGILYVGATQPDRRLRWGAFARAASTFVGGLGSARFLMRGPGQDWLGQGDLNGRLLDL